MLSIEEIKLLIEKLEKVKKEDLQELIDSNLKILKDIALSVDMNNTQTIGIFSQRDMPCRRTSWNTNA